MKLNNKGFAVSIVLYSISAVVILVLLLILAVELSNAKNSSNLAEQIKENISGLSLEE